MQETLDRQLKTEYYLVWQGDEYKLPDPEKQECSDLWDMVLHIHSFSEEYENVRVRQRNPLIEEPNEKGTISHYTSFTSLKNPYASELERRCEPYYDL